MKKTFFSDLLYLLSVFLVVPVAIYSFAIKQWWPILVFIVVVAVAEYFVSKARKKERGSD